MAEPLNYLKQRANDDWFVGDNSQEFFRLVEQARQELNDLQQQTPINVQPIVLLAERDPLKFLARFIVACTTPCHLFLCNPNWAESEWQQVFELIQPDLIWGQGIGNKSQGTGENSKFKIQNSKLLKPHPSPLAPHPSPALLIMIPTGGSSGKLRFAMHTWDTLMASVAGFQQYFGVNQINSFCVLPLYHVSGLMQVLRSFTSGGKLVILPFKSVAAANLSDIDPKDFFLSLVPTQLQRLLLTPHSSLLTPWLAQFKTVLLGGAPAWSELLEQARQQGIRLAPTYGMTETASQVVTLKPDDFLSGQTGCGQVLPHAQVTICSETGESLAANQIGMITIRAESLALGYYRKELQEGSDAFSETFEQLRLGGLPPTPPSTRVQMWELDASGRLTGQGFETVDNEQFSLVERERAFQTDDLGYFDAQGYLHIVGRRSDKIITGGENVFPAEVEAAIRETGLVKDVCVVGVGDRIWGQAVTAIYVPRRSEMIVIEILKASLADRLSKFKQPKHWIAVDELPRNTQGKINRQGLMAMLELLPTDLSNR